MFPLVFCSHLRLSPSLRIQAGPAEDPSETGHDCPLVVVANKLDKVKKSQREECMETVRSTLTLTEGDTLIPFSAEDGTGRDALLAALEALR